MEIPAMVVEGHLFLPLLARVTAAGTRRVKGLDPRPRSGLGQGMEVEVIEQQVGDSVSAKSAASP